MKLAAILCLTYHHQNAQFCFKLLFNYAIIFVRYIDQGWENQVLSPAKVIGSRAEKEKGEKEEVGEEVRRR